MGRKRRLGDYEEASVTSRGLFVVATSDRRVVALEPDGDVRWTVTRPRPVGRARALSGFRIAYREGNTVRVVVGDGTNDHLLARAPPRPSRPPGSPMQVATSSRTSTPKDGSASSDVDTRAALVGA